jgi:hypothetical protein
MRTVLPVTATTVVGMALLSCTAPPQFGNSAAISFGTAGFDIGAIMGSVLAQMEVYVVPTPVPVAYGAPRRMPKSHGHRSHSRSAAASPVVAHGPRPGPRPSKSVDPEIQSGAVEQKSEAKFNAAQAKAEKLGVHKLTGQDIDGLSREQLRQIRGY